MEQRPSPRYCFQTRTIRSRGHFSTAFEPYIPGMPTMKVPNRGACETVEQFINRFNNNRYHWELGVQQGRYHYQVLSTTRENMDKTRVLKPPKNVDIKKLIRPSDRWFAVNPFSSLRSLVESGDYIRAEDLSAAFMNDPDSVAKYVVAHLNMDSTMYFLVESPRNNWGQPLFPANVPQPNMPQPNMQPVAAPPRPSLAIQNQPQNLQSCNIPDNDPSVSNISFPAPFSPEQ
ncbi:2f090bbb-a23b-440a-a6a2-0cae517ad1af [Sclerotinia trifoliorum]|uniref:2f090bbb-a23b-440a-a6a2-0cae517ad1af n=1 Tax=Sclerotinia trifoliorum TaxID=28548 RepID=A0A8H2VV20_9HELO|nr:2f090bbb-a23b-440a-a6a2-0cae517ad1af [Sclerotinia trifoliorum]